MTAITSKVCIVGDFAVGKTSVVERFVNNQFSDKYLTTVGVKVDTKEVDLPDRGVEQKLVLWEIAGADTFGAKEFAYLRGASGIIFVADGTRPLTLDSVRSLKTSIAERHGQSPAVLLINKRDLSDQWDVADTRVAELTGEFGHVYLTSAKTGVEVESALTRIANLIVDDVLAGR